AGCSGVRNGLGDLRNQQVGNDAGVQRPGTQENQIRMVNGLHSLGQRVHSPREERYFLNRFAASSNFRLSVNAATVGKRRYQIDIRQRGGKYAPSDSQDFAAHPDGFRKISGDVSQSSQEQVPKIVATQPAAGVKPILEQPTEQGFVL